MAAAAVHLAAAATAVMLLLLAAEAVDVADVVGTLQQQLELARTWQHAQMQNRRVKMYVYDLPSQFHSAGPPLGAKLVESVKQSEYCTTNGEEADFWLIPGSGHYRSQQLLLDVFDHVRQNYPWWNRTRDAGQARHLIMLLSDDGPGSAAFDRPIQLGNNIPLDVHPMNPNKTVVYLQWNGMRDGLGGSNWTACTSCFQIGKDIMIPTAENICGPLCGYDLGTLRAKSIWALGEADLQAEVTRRRTYRLFYGGKIGDPSPTDFTGRGPVFHFHVNRTGYLIVRKGDHEPVSFANAMRDADFCYSPMGQNGGDTDRYVAAIMFGCIPVMLNSSHGATAVPHALPLEEVLHWERFGTIVNTADLESLDEQLRCLEPYVPMMRHAMRDVWQRMLYSNAYDRSYLGEDRHHDAMHTIMQILEARMAHGCHTPKAAMERMAHRPRRFPCTNRPARLYLPGLQAVAPRPGQHEAGAQSDDSDLSHHQHHHHHLRRILRGLRGWEFAAGPGSGSAAAGRERDAVKRLLRLS